MAEKNGNGSPDKPTRKPFKKDERAQTFELLGKNEIKIDDLKIQLKKLVKNSETLKEDIRQGGYLEDEQGQLPIEEEQEDRPSA